MSSTPNLSLPTLPANSLQPSVVLNDALQLIDALLHLAVEDQALYPSLQRGGDADLARLGRKYQAEMAPLAQAYDAFVRRWNTAQHLREDADGFRADANDVLRRLHERMQRENLEFYPRIEAQAELA